MESVADIAYCTLLHVIAVTFLYKFIGLRIGLKSVLYYSTYINIFDIEKTCMIAEWCKFWLEVGRYSDLCSGRDERIEEGLKILCNRANVIGNDYV